MEKKSTEDLENTLKSTHIRDFDRFRETNRESLAEGEELFSGYIKEKIRKKGLTQQMVFLMADIPERYGYKLLSGEKKTRQRDIILRICYAAELSLEETQEALRKYPMPGALRKDSEGCAADDRFQRAVGECAGCEHAFKETRDGIAAPQRRAGLEKKSGKCREIPTGAKSQNRWEYTGEYKNMEE